MSDMKLSRRDLLEACKLAGVSLGDLSTDPLGNLAMMFIAEKRAGETDLEFEPWLDEDFEVDVEVEEPSDPS